MPSLIRTGFVLQRNWWRHALSAVHSPPGLCVFLHFFFDFNYIVELLLAGLNHSLDKRVRSGSCPNWTPRSPEGRPWPAWRAGTQDFRGAGGAPGDPSSVRSPRACRGEGLPAFTGRAPKDLGSRPGAPPSFPMCRGWSGGGRGFGLWRPHKFLYSGGSERASAGGRCTRRGSSGRSHRPLPGVLVTPWGSRAVTWPRCPIPSSCARNPHSTCLTPLPAATETLYSRCIRLIARAMVRVSLSLA